LKKSWIGEKIELFLFRQLSSEENLINFYEKYVIWLRTVLKENCQKTYVSYKIIEFSSEKSWKNKSYDIFSPIYDFFILKTKKIEENKKDWKTHVI
jgi:hypothetical protein